MGIMRYVSEYLRMVGINLFGAIFGLLAMAFVSKGDIDPSALDSNTLIVVLGAYLLGVGMVLFLIGTDKGGEQNAKL